MRWCTHTHCTCTLSVWQDWTAWPSQSLRPVQVRWLQFPARDQPIKYEQLQQSRNYLSLSGFPHYLSFLQKYFTCCLLLQGQGPEKAVFYVLRNLHSTKLEVLDIHPQALLCLVVTQWVLLAAWRACCKKGLEAYKTVQYNTKVSYETEQYKRVQCSTIQNRTIQENTLKTNKQKTVQYNRI